MNILHLLAQGITIDPTTVKVPAVSAVDILAGALNVVYFAAGATAIVIIVLAGYTFTTAVYDPAKITQAKNSLIYAITGLIVVIFAFAITQFILRRF